MSDKPQENVLAAIVDDHLVEEKQVAELLNAPAVKLKIDGREVEIRPASYAVNPKTNKPFARPTTIYDAALQAGIKIPILCHREHMTPVAVCRFCVVELEGQYRLAPACQRQVEKGMVVKTIATSDKVKNAVKVLTELLLADHDTPREAHREYGDNELRTIAKSLGMSPHASRFPRTARDRGHDETSVVIAVDHNACILCDRCIRGCGEIRGNEVIGRMNKGYRARIAFDLNDPMGESSCVSCGECMVSCPTGALTNRRFVLPQVVKEAPGVQPIDPERLYEHPLFEGVSKQFLGWNKGSIVRRQYKAGDIICREGEFGNTAFILEKGEVEVYLNAPIKHAKTYKEGHKGRTGLFGMFFKFATGLVSRGEDPNDLRDGLATGTAKRYIPVDAPVSLDLKQARPAATLTPEDLIFGEMSCMNNYPRSATVRAKTDVTVLEILRNVLYILQRNKKSKQMLDDVYRRRAIEGQLRSVDLFADLLENEARFQEFVTHFRAQMTLVRLNPGEVIFRQDDPADNFYLVKLGFVKVSQRQPGGEHVLTYVGPGGYIGEIGLLSDIPEVAALGAPAGLRVATCAALDHVDLVKISGVAFQEIIAKFPEVRERLIGVAVRRLEENEANRRRAKAMPVGEFVRQGLMNAQSLLVLDLEKCTRCDECTKACSDAHSDVTRLIREGLRFENWLVASSCRSCLDPYCMVGCPVDSIHRKSSREMVIEDWCIGCGNCAKNCPYGNINMHGFDVQIDDPNHPGQKTAVVQQKATMCDLCAGLDGQPSCVYACPHDAAHRYSGEDFRRIVETRRYRR